MKNTPFLLALLLVPSCGGSSSDPVTPTDAAVPGPDADSSGCDHAAALCAKLDQCAPFLLKAIYRDATTSTDRLTKACTEQSRSIGTVMTAASLKQCADALDVASCDSVFANNVPSCSFHGTL